jgi:hypothetical protein
MSEEHLVEKWMASERGPAIVLEPGKDVDNLTIEVADGEKDKLKIINSLRDILHRHRKNFIWSHTDPRNRGDKLGYIYLNKMTGRDGNEYSAYVKLNPETGYPMTSRTLEGFEDKREFKIPQEINGVTLTTNQRAELQDSKPILIEGMTQSQKRLSEVMQNADRESIGNATKKLPDFSVICPIAVLIKHLVKIYN